MTSAFSTKLLRFGIGALLLVAAFWCTPSAAPQPAGGPPPAMVSFDYSKWSVSESNSTASVTVTMTGTPTGTVSVSVSTSDGTAIAGANYTANSQSLVWQPSDAGTSIATKTFTIVLVNDQQARPPLTVNLTLSGLNSNASFGPYSTSLLYIYDANGTCNP
ncbi:MAG: hypothetical protein EXR98_20825 [Gemmataceae bacterium]|nr:hypothetical protein [Gemmataceae bacterium]